MNARSMWTGNRKTLSRRVRPQVELLESRLTPYALSGNAWPSPQLITISFVPDGTVLGSNGSGPITSNLHAAWDAHFGSAATWENLVLKAAQTWAQQTNINFAVVPDDGAAIGTGNYQQGDPGMGDIRIGGYNFGPGGALAQADLPPPANNYSIAGDIQFDTGVGFNNGTTYDLYTVAMHEIGHALGLYHSSSSTAVMYGAYTGTKHGLSTDDISGIRAVYSAGAARSPDLYDVGLGNNSFLTATPLTNLIDPNLLTALVGNLDITTTSDVDYYTFLAPLNTSGTLTVTVQSQGLSLLAPKAWIYAADQSTVLAYASGAGHYGTTLTLTVNNVTPLEQLYLKVAGADTTPFGTGDYAVTLNFGTGTQPTVQLPNTTLPNGNPISSGGGLALEPPGTEAPGRDVFPDPGSVAVPPVVVPPAATPAGPTADVPAVSVVPPATPHHLTPGAEGSQHPGRHHHAILAGHHLRRPHRPAAEGLSQLLRQWLTALKGSVGQLLASGN
jgi:hypothetical protein